LDHDGFDLGRSPDHRAYTKTKEEIDAEINALRDEAEDEMKAIERLQMSPGKEEDNAG
jgi:hypothetical protein